MRDFAPSPAKNPVGRGSCFPSRTGLCLYSGLLFLFLFVSSLLSAQGLRPMDKKIDFRIDSMSLHDALRKIRDLSDVHITYNVEEIKNQPKVTLNLVNMTVRSIFEKLLEHTNLQFVEGSGQEILIIPKKRKKDPVKAEVYENVKGQVVDRKGYPLPNASIQLSSDKSTGYTTDSKGFFNITAPQNDHLKVSYLGMKGVDEPIKIGVFIKIVLDTLPAVMHEYVVNGYQTVDKRMLASSVVTLTPDKFLEPGVPSVDQMLQGKVPGLMVVNNSGSPSATPQLRIRGTSTILGNAAPLWVVDNVVKEDPVNLNPLQVNSALQDAQNANFAIVGNAIAGLNPYDIESLTFLKDASATAIYGVRAANGVIIVTTKKGKAGPPSISYNVNLGSTDKPNYRTTDAMNSKDRIDVSREAISKGIFYAASPFPYSYEGLVNQLNLRQITQAEFAQKVGQLETMNTDWLGMLTTHAFNQSHSLSISGGMAKSTYYASLRYSDANGAFIGDGTKAYSGLFNLTTFITNRLNINLSLDADLRTANGYYQLNPMDYALKTSRAISADSSYPIGLPNSNSIGNGSLLYLHYNIFNEMSQTGNKTSTQDATASIGINYRIVDGLSWSSLFSGNTSGNRSFAYAADHSHFVSNIRGYDYGQAPIGSFPQTHSSLPFGGLAYPSDMFNVSYTIRNSLNYSCNFFGGRDQLSLMGTQEIHSVKADGTANQEIGYYPDRGNTYYNNGAGEGSPTYQSVAVTTNTIQNTLSWLGVASYRLKKKYIINANIRTDGSNRFGQYANQKFLPTWSVAGRWDLSEEPWMTKSKMVSGISLRASYGTSGNVVTQVGPNLIAGYPSSPIDNASSEYVLSLVSLPYPDLRWEQTHQVNLGVDANLFNGRINFTVDAYYKKTNDLLISRNIPEEYGIAQMYMNYGNMDNSGFDASFNFVPVRTKDFSWSQAFVYSMNFNKVTQSSIINQLSDYLGGTAVIQGKPLHGFYSYDFAGLDPQKGFPTYNFKGQAGQQQATVTPDSWLNYSGRKDPLLNVATSTTLRYKRLMVMAQISVNLGAEKRLNPIYSATNGYAPAPDQNLPKELNGRWRNPGDEKTTNIPGFANTSYMYLPGNVGGSLISANAYNMYDQSTARVISGNFVRIRNITASYSLAPQFMKGIGVKGAGINLSVSNPFILTSKRFNGQDPEILTTGGAALPIIKSYNLSMNLNF
jgi:TonB-linked SusC/RagA family outer membrane protein